MKIVILEDGGGIRGTRDEEARKKGEGRHRGGSGREDSHVMGGETEGRGRKVTDRGYSR